MITTIIILLILISVLGFTTWNLLRKLEKYEDVQENVDATAEKLIGVFDTSLVNLDSQMQIVCTQAEKYKVDNKTPIMFFKAAIAAEEEFQKISMSLYDNLEQEDKLTLGMDDLIAAQASDSEERLYLLKSLFRTC